MLPAQALAAAAAVALVAAVAAVQAAAPAQPFGSDFAAAPPAAAAAPAAPAAAAAAPVMAFGSDFAAVPAPVALAAGAPAPTKTVPTGSFWDVVAAPSGGGSFNLGGLGAVGSAGGGGIAVSGPRLAQSPRTVLQALLTARRQGTATQDVPTDDDDYDEAPQVQDGKPAPAPPAPRPKPSKPPTATKKPAASKKPKSTPTGTKKKTKPGSGSKKKPPAGHSATAAPKPPASKVKPKSSSHSSSSKRKTSTAPRRTSTSKPTHAPTTTTTSKPRTHLTPPSTTKKKTTTAAAATSKPTATTTKKPTSTSKKPTPTSSSSKKPTTKKTATSTTSTRKAAITLYPARDGSGDLVGTVGIGKPAQEFDVYFSTDSLHSFVGSTECTTCNASPFSSVYDHDASEYALLEDDPPYALLYNDNGVVGRDLDYYGTTTYDLFRLSAFGLSDTFIDFTELLNASTSTTSFDAADGTIGLGLPSNSDLAPEDSLQPFLLQGSNYVPWFAVTVASDLTSATIRFGGSGDDDGDADDAVAEISAAGGGSAAYWVYVGSVYSDDDDNDDDGGDFSAWVEESGLWALAVDAVAVVGGRWDAAAGDEYAAVVDMVELYLDTDAAVVRPFAYVGTADAVGVLPGDALDEVAGRLRGAAYDDDGVLRAPCSAADVDGDAPGIVFWFASGLAVTLGASSYLVPFNGTACSVAFYADPSTDVYPVLPLHAMRGIATVFDLEEKRVGFVLAPPSY
ncbi:aspartic peptidase domain-containing protein [Zopfochytrium polystomum]|nr:aspartic peptidase domain-containing protein [Zopfochytrium polystomum]